MATNKGNKGKNMGIPTPGDKDVPPDEKETGTAPAGNDGADEAPVADGPDTSFMRGQGWDDFEGMEEDLDKEQQARQAARIFRFWMKPETSTRVVLLDSKPPIITEHQVQIDGDWKNWFTCIADIYGECPCCDRKNQPETLGFFTMIDMAEYVDGQGNERKNERRLLPAKYTLLKNLKKIVKEHGDLRGMVFDVTRTSSRSVNTGDKWEYVGRLSEEELNDLNADTSPAPYASILAPMKPDAMRIALRGNPSAATEDEAVADEELDF